MLGQTQSSVLENITGKLKKYCSSYPWEEVYLHTDRKEYVAGEDIWLKAYLIDRQTFRLTGNSRILYVEVINSGSRPVVQKRLILENGTGPGQLSLPDTLSPGYYTLRAYTNWMKNFMPVNCFSKKIRIYNALGNKPVIIKPAENQLISKVSGTREEGISIELDNSGASNLGITIKTNQFYRIRNGNNCFLVVDSRGNIITKSALNFSDDNLVVYISKNQLMQGINRLTIFNAAGRPVAERLFFSRPPEKAGIEVMMNETAGLREKLSVEIKNGIISDKVGNISNLSVSVTEAGRNGFPDIEEYMIFGSEFGEIPEEFIKTGILNLPEELIEKYLSVIRSNWIDWDRILSENIPPIKYTRETETHFIYGKLLNRNSQAPDSNRFLFLSIPGKHAMFQYGLTDKNGDFYFKIPADDKIRDLIIQPEEPYRNNSIKIESSFSDRYVSLFQGETTEISDNQLIPKLAVNYQVMKIYSSDDLPSKPESVSFTRGSQRFYGKPDIEIVMDDYIKLPVMQEVFFELMPGIFMKKKKSDFEITIMDPVENRIYDKPPLLFVDGVVVNDPNLIANMDPEKVEKIDGIKSRYFIGNYLFYGLVNIITRTGDFSLITLPDYAVRLPYRVSEPVKDFAAPDYSSDEMKKRRIPDFRNTIYWNPSITTDNNGNTSFSFWTSDYKSEFELYIQGVDGNGNFVSVKKIVNVK
jgi:hypothetical protein